MDLLIPPNALALGAFLFGACVGSFLNVVIYRVPAGLSIVSPRSHCPACETFIPGWLNIPILSWVLLRGKCAACKAPISVRYPLVELVTALLWLAVVRTFGFSAASLVGVTLVSALVAVTFIDLDVWMIPDEISLPGIVLGGLVRPWAFDAPWYDGPLAAAIGAGMLAFVRWVFLRLRGVEGMGLGDVKLIAMLGAFLGLSSLLPILLVASLAGSTIGLLAMAAGSGEEGPEETSEPDASSTAASSEEDDGWEPPARAIPFGPFLALGGLFYLFFGPAFLRWLKTTPSPLIGLF